MGLTSRSLEIAVVALAVVLVALTVWQWPRLSGRGARVLLGRLGAVVVTQVALVCALALAVNNSFEFYGSWDDLLGNEDKAPVAVSDNGGQYASVGTTKGALVQPAGPQGLDRVTGLPQGPADKVGKMESVRIVGRRSGAINPAFVYLPPQYFQPQFRRQRFPVMVVISGYPGGIMNLAQHLQIPQNAGRLIAKGAMQPTVMVMVRPTIAPPRDTECVDVPGGPQAETFFTKDLPDAMRSAYRVGHDASAWGAFGYSSGGTCSLQLAMRNPKIYTSAVSLSGDYAIKDDLTTGSLFGTGPEGAQREREHDLLWRMEHLPVPQISALVASSRKGEPDYGATMDFLHAAKAPMTVDSIILPRGSHQFGTWRREVVPALEWQSRQLTFPQDVVAAPHKPAAPHGAQAPHDGKPTEHPTGQQSGAPATQAERRRDPVESAAQD
ncbi:alpha/beta hydrolase [Streptomyces benahoarensis]|uniref:Esterase n=1 Tax=Streptomyces benahoarensis TaxID=2595054 RepID=A0A553YZV1_9ACTN|nr:alpha/beta hydrolase-fold protein [Streptomyces benahoarensis]TSB18078.1 esterase [Streptomyces benahoarensis]TSB34745.1 esterase [Streptomyces benahoarensis]